MILKRRHKKALRVFGIWIIKWIGVVGSAPVKCVKYLSSRADLTDLGLLLLGIGLWSIDRTISLIVVGCILVLIGLFYRRA